nr:HAMP domain-containing sensor histidine kinase [Dyella sp. ASV24]
MFARNKSLVFQLSWRVIGLQLLAVLGLIVVITFSYHHDNVSYIDDSVPRVIQDALYVDPSGHLALADSKDVQTLLHAQPGLWFIVEDDQGRRLEHGDVPATYRPLAAELSHLQTMEIHDSRPPYALTMRTRLGETSFGQVRIMCGGVASVKLGPVLVGVASYLVWRMSLPLVVATLVVMPWLIRRAISGVREVAEQARAINIDERSARLADQAVPRELQPMVQAFNAALGRLNEGYEARDRFLVDAAHELRAPIAILEARIETLVAGASRSRLLADVARLSNLAEQLLDLQRLSRPQEAFEPIDLVTLSGEVAADVAPMVVDAGYELALDAPDKDVMVMGDRMALSRALTNLLQNAIAHGGGRGVITIGVKEDGTLGVSDQGPGVPVEERHRIFDPFYRLRPSSSGAGLGLHLVQEIIALHRGRVEVTEAEGGGACFRMSLPRCGDIA